MTPAAWCCASATIRAASFSRLVWRSVANGRAKSPLSSDTATPRFTSPGSTPKARIVSMALCDDHVDTKRHPRHARIPFGLYGDIGGAGEGQAGHQTQLRSVNGLAAHQIPHP